jgi:hypothetical protein
MTDTAENPRAVIGSNQPSPYEAIKLDADTLMETAQGFLDGQPITTQAVADEVGKLLDMARKGRAAAEEQRKAEAKPFDDGKKAVQALWTPLTDEKTGKFALITSTAKKALAPFLAAEQRRIDEEAAAARKLADEATAKAQEALRASSDDLAKREAAEQLLKDAKKADTAANKAEKGKALATGGARSVSLRKVWSAELVNANVALSHYKKTRPVDLKAWLAEQARKDVDAGSLSIPGFEISSTDVAQ